MFSENKITKDISRAKKYFEDIVSYTVGPYTLKDMIKSGINGFNIVDVRDYDDYIDSHIPYAKHIPLSSISENDEDKSKITVIYTYSDSCPRAYKAAIKFLDKNAPCVVLRGGFKQWKKFDFDTIKSDSSSSFER